MVTGTTGEPTVLLRAYVPPGTFVRSEYRAVLLLPGRREEVVREYADDPLVALPLSRAAPGDIRIEAREAGAHGAAPARYVLDRRVFTTLDATVLSELSAPAR